MKVVVNNDKVSTDRVYPYIGENSNIGIVLFIGYKNGIVLQSKDWTVGMQGRDFDERHFKPLVGSITLSND